MTSRKLYFLLLVAGWAVLLVADLAKWVSGHP